MSYLDEMGTAYSKLMTPDPTAAMVSPNIQQAIDDGFIDEKPTPVGPRIEYANRETPAEAKPYLHEYKVASGDTLSKIAKDNGTTVDALAELNGIEDVDSLAVDQELTLGSKELPAEEAEETGLSAGDTELVQESPAEEAGTPPTLFSQETVDLTPLPKGEVLKSRYYQGEDNAVAEVEKREGELTELQKRIIRSEGFVSVPYFDTKGIKTIGVGQTGKYMGMSFKDTFDAHIDEADSLVIDKKKVSNLPEPAKDIIREMTYQMGVDKVAGPKGFNKMFTALQKDPPDYNTAADEMLDSDWYNKDTPERALKLANEMRAITTE